MDTFCCSWLIQTILCMFAQSVRRPYMSTHNRHLSLVHRGKLDNPKHVDQVGFLYVLETWDPPLAGGFCGILSGFVYFLSPSTELFIELVITDCLLLASFSGFILNYCDTELCLLQFLHTLSPKILFLNCSHNYIFIVKLIFWMNDVLCLLTQSKWQWDGLVWIVGIYHALVINCEHITIVIWHMTILC